MNNPIEKKGKRHEQIVYKKEIKMVLTLKKKITLTHIVLVNSNYNEFIIINNNL